MQESGERGVEKAKVMEKGKERKGKQMKANSIRLKML